MGPWRFWRMDSQPGCHAGAEAEAHTGGDAPAGETGREALGDGRRRGKAAAGGIVGDLGK